MTYTEAKPAHPLEGEAPATQPITVCGVQLIESQEWDEAAQANRSHYRGMIGPIEVHVTNATDPQGFVDGWCARASWGRKLPMGVRGDSEDMENVAHALQTKIAKQWLPELAKELGGLAIALGWLPSWIKAQEAFDRRLELESTMNDWRE